MTGATGSEHMPPAPPRVRGGALRVASCALALVLVALGLAGVHEALVAWGALDGTGAVSVALDRLTGIDPAGSAATAGTLVGVVAVLLGLGLLVVAVRRPRERALTVRDAPVVVLTPQDVARLTSAAVSEVDGVLGVTSVASGRRVRVDVETTGGSAVAEQARDAARQRLAGLAPSPDVRVRVRGPGRTAPTSAPAPAPSPDRSAAGHEGRAQ